MRYLHVHIYLFVHVGHGRVDRVSVWHFEKHELLAVHKLMTGLLCLPGHTSLRCICYSHSFFLMSIHGDFTRPAISVRVSMFMHFKMTRIHSESLADGMFEREKGRRPSPSPKWRYLFSPAGLDPTRVRGDVQRAVLYSQDLVLDKSSVPCSWMPVRSFA